VAVNWQNLTPPQALQALLDIWGLEMTQLPGNPILRIEAKESGTVGWQATKTNLWQIVSTNGPAAAGDEVVTDIAMEKVALIDGVRTLALQAKLNIQFDPGLMNQKAADGSLNVSSIITQKWRNVTARQVLQELLDKHGWQMTQTPGIPIVRIVAKSP
jgi:hypothetical protein